MVSMREDGVYKASKGITTLEEVLRLIYHNEGDLDTRRTIDEIVALLEEGPSKEAELDLSDYKIKMIPTNEITPQRDYAN